jgi:hypothetical protein
MHLRHYLWAYLLASLIAELLRVVHDALAFICVVIVLAVVSVRHTQSSHTQSRHIIERLVDPLRCTQCIMWASVILPVHLCQRTAVSCTALRVFVEGTCLVSCADLTTHTICGFGCCFLAWRLFLAATACPYLVRHAQGAKVLSSG